MGKHNNNKPDKQQNKTGFIITLFFTACLSLTLLTGCKTKEETAVRDVFAMDTYMNLKATGKNPDAALDEAVEEITRLEGLLSVTKEESDISRINRSGGKPVSVEKCTVQIIEKSFDIGNRSNGYLDISVYPIVKEWGFTTGSHKIPDRQTLNALLENVDYSRIKTEGDYVTVPENFQIDTGALAKGYTSDRIMDILRKKGIKSAIISLGGNVQTIGKKSDGSLWSVGVTNPFEPENMIGVIHISDKAVITSGSYERYFIGEDGKRYHHIIDQKTGCPAENGLVSVTIIGDSGLECDALSTALFAAGYENATKYWRMYGGFDMVLVTDTGMIYYTEGISDYFENISYMPSEVIVSGQ